MPQHKRVKVLQCIRQGQIGGGESHLLGLVEHLDKRLFEPVVLSFTDGPMIDKLQQLGVKTKVMHTTRPFDLTKWQRIKQWMLLQQFDLVHAHGTRAVSNIIWPAHRLNVPVVYTIHGWSFHNDQNKFVKSVRVLGERYITNHTAVNISVSQSNKETGKRHFKNFEAEVIYNGINTRRFNPDNRFSDIRAELDIPDDALVCVFIARLTHQKQPKVMVEAFLKAADANPRLYLLMVGNGELKHEVEQQVNLANLKHRIQLVNFREDVPDLLRAADIYVLPSLWEGLPIGLLEAMSMGKAVIATKVDGTGEIVRHLENGFLIETENLTNNLTDALRTLGNNSLLRSKLESGARKIVSDRFDINSMTRRIEDVYFKYMTQ